MALEVAAGEDAAVVVAAALILDHTKNLEAAAAALEAEADSAATAAVAEEVEEVVAARSPTKPRAKSTRNLARTRRHNRDHTRRTMPRDRVAAAAGIAAAAATGVDAPSRLRCPKFPRSLC